MLGRLNRYVKNVSILLITAALIAGMVGCGPISQNLEIRTWYDLDAIRDNLGGDHTLMNNLDSTTAGYKELASPTANEGKGWQPIGAWGYRFAGSFDGQGYEIRDLFIARPDDDSTVDDDWVGLFSVVDGTGVVRNVGVVNADVLGSRRVGALIGQNRGNVVNCYSTGSVGGVGFVGGLVGLNDGWQDMLPALGTVSDSYSAASVSGEWSTGGLVGNNGAGTLTRSYSIGHVTGHTLIGGLVGINVGPINDCYSDGNVTGDMSVGGLMGRNWGTVSNSYYNHDEVLINDKNIITIGALFGEDFEEWLTNDKFLDVNDRLSQEDGYYLVDNVTDFIELLAFGQDASLKYRLTNDLDLASEPDFYIPYLAGEVDGDGYRILNLSFNFDFVSQVGLFGYLAPTGKISQVGVENVNITGGRFIGGLVGYNDGTVSSSYSSGSVTGALWVGGLVGDNDNTVSSSYSTSNVTGDSSVGGLVGVSDRTVSSSYSTSNVIGVDCVGGLVGQTWGGTVSDSYSTGSVTGNSSVGGLVGHIFLGDVNNSYSTGNVTGYEDVGGLVGANDGFVSNSFWDTETSGQATSDGGTGKNTTEMKDIDIFSVPGWDITTVINSSERNPAYIWNIVNGMTYPFLSWQP